MANKTQILCPYCMSWNLKEGKLEEVKSKSVVSKSYQCNNCKAKFKALYDIKFSKIEKVT